MSHKGHKQIRFIRISLTLLGFIVRGFIKLLWDIPILIFAYEFFGGPIGSRGKPSFLLPRAQGSQLKLCRLHPSCARHAGLRRLSSSSQTSTASPFPTVGKV